MDRNRIIRTASIISIAGNAVLSASKIIIGLMSGSMSVVSDGIDSMTDIFISIITLFVAKIIDTPPDAKHPYGHFRAETIATAVLSFIMFFIGGQLAMTTIDKLANHPVIEMPGIWAVYVTVFSIFGKILLSYSQYALGKKSRSEMLKANCRNMLNDVVTSTGVLMGLCCAFYFHMPVIDRIIAIIISVWIMFSAVRIFMGTLTELMEGEVDQELYNKIFEVVRKSDGVGNPHRVRITKLGVLYTIDMDVEVDGNIKVSDAHDLVMALEDKIRSEIPNVYDIVVHIEPMGHHENHEKNECYGLAEHNIRQN
ncbi:MAG TPA: cation diffusion facilitator family transporter [Clostridiales bacterium]|nr:cation diffusion facilitator family transporter [Clostridiales bacterium]HQP69316.1 cation diffusion facilitator family transporter [Clostridiales bacterium]